MRDHETDAEKDQAVLDAHAASPCDNTFGLCDAADAILAQRAAEQLSYDLSYEGQEDALRRRLAARPNPEPYDYRVVQAAARKPV